jgi:hypothetical protein
VSSNLTFGTYLLEDTVKFELSDIQIEKANIFMAGQREKQRTKDFTGARFEFRFLPTGLGELVTVKDLQTREAFDLTEDWG